MSRETTSPLVTVVIPAYRSADYLNQALGSVRDQTFSDWEAVVVDDASGDDVVSRYRLDARTRLIRHERRQGGSAARNTGVEAAGGRYVAFLDMDDLWDAGKLEQQVRALEARPSAALTYCHYTQVDDALARIPDQVAFVPAGPDPLRRMIRGNLIRSCSLVLVRREVFRCLGGFDAALRATADWDLWIRLAARFEMIADTEPRVRYRVHSSQLSADTTLMRRENVLVLRKLLPQLHAIRPDLVPYCRRRLCKALRKAALSERRAGQGAVARSYLREAVGIWPWSPKVYLELARLALSTDRQP